MNYIIICVSILFFLPLLGEEPQVETSPIQLRYVKVGTECGIGYRWHRDKHGVDLSVNFSSILIDNWVSAKALYLQYPWYAQHRYFYWGAGAGFIHEEFLLPQPIAGCSKTNYPSLEGLVGYEFNAEKKIKYFLQLGVSVPMTKDAFPFLPALAFGVGF
jgi:hypothetical protein